MDNISVHESLSGELNLSLESVTCCVRFATNVAFGSQQV